MEVGNGDNYVDDEGEEEKKKNDKEKGEFEEEEEDCEGEVIQWMERKK